MNKLKIKATPDSGKPFIIVLKIEDIEKWRSFMSKEEFKRLNEMVNK
jgi:hypothetical protein